jgi:magnesium transporter
MSARRRGASRRPRHAPRPTTVGASPGSVVYAGPERSEAVTAEVLCYGPEGAVVERSGLALEQALELVAGQAGVRWLNLTGVHDVAQVQRVGEAFGLHPLTLEDIVSLGQRPKVEPYERYLYVVLRMLSLPPDPSADHDPELHAEQLSLVLLDGVLVTFQEQAGDLFDPIRARIRQGKGRIRTMGADYLAYGLIDIVIDTYFGVLERFGDAIEDLEEIILTEPTTATLQRVNHLKRETLQVRRSVWPLRELMSALQREEGGLVSRPVLTFLRDAHDHAVQVMDTVETQREMLTGLHDMYLSALSYRMNDIMRVLTIIATIFIPLSFLVGVYGMNFKYMPELHWRWAYPALWAVMLLTGGGMLAAFRRNHWL